MTQLTRTRPKPPVRALHLGLGNFFRAHQAWYTHHAADGRDWGIAAFTGRGGSSAVRLGEQDGLYTLDVRSAGGDEFEVIESVVAVHDADDRRAWLQYWSDPAVQYVTLTVTEAGYRRAPGGGLDVADPAVAADIAALRDAEAVASTAPGRIVAGLLARRAADAGGFTIIPCDNLPGNAAALAAVVADLVEAVDPSLSDWMQDNVSFVSTAVDRITPATTDTDRQRIEAATGRQDGMPVVTEPFAEWVLGGTFAGQHPDWESAGAVITDDVAAYEARKLTLLNGAHSLLAYAGSLRGHATVAQAVADPLCRAWVDQWWDEACPHLPMPEAALRSYREALLARFANPAIEHTLAQIAMDGSQKLPVRILPTLRAERASGRVPVGACRVLAAWVAYVRRPDGPAADPLRETLVDLGRGSLEQSVPRLLGVLDPDLPADEAAVAQVVRLAAELRAG